MKFHRIPVIRAGKPATPSVISNRISGSSNADKAAARSARLGTILSVFFFQLFPRQIDAAGAAPDGRGGCDGARLFWAQPTAEQFHQSITKDLGDKLD